MADQNHADPIHQCLDRWHRWLRGDLPEGLDVVLHDECIFLSPIVFTPQVGREITSLYLSAAAGSLSGSSAGGGAPAEGFEDAESSGDTEPGSFRYVKEIVGGNQAALEFETTVEGKYVNGVDIITCDDDSLITEFKVMIRPLQAVNLVHAQMRAMLESMQD
ncbi:MAG: nuclear transport factor 2 family protein [Microthrixaceae bacterium]